MSYLLSRGLDADIIAFLESSKSKECTFIPFTVKRYDYAVYHFLDNSGKIGYDFNKVNKQLQTDDTAFVAVALVEGDDVICVNTEDGHIYLWLIQSRDGDMLSVAKTFREFLKISIDEA